MLENALDLVAIIRCIEGVDEITLLQNRVGLGEESIAISSDKGDASARGDLNFCRGVADPGCGHVDFGKAHGAAGVAVFLLSAHGNNSTQDLTGGPGDGCNGRDTEALIDFGSARVVDARYDALDAVGLAGHASRKNIAVVSTRYGRECVSALDARRFEGFAVKADTGQGQAAKAESEAPEGAGVLVYDGNRVAEVIKAVGQQRANSAAAHDHNVHS